MAAEEKRNDFEFQMLEISYLQTVLSKCTSAYYKGYCILNSKNHPISYVEQASLKFVLREIEKDCLKE